MKKFTDFIIDKRYIILFLFIILSIISVILSNKVNINYEIAEYLPDTSETRIGMDIMEEKFKEIKSSSLNLMFKDVSEEDKKEILSYLNNIEGVSSVDYDESENYNKDGYTLFVINVDDLEDSELSSQIYNNIKEHFKDYEVYTSGSIANRNKPVLSMSTMVLAVGCALVILMIMSESYVEPILFLISILMAVVLNKGSNIIFDSVSNITDSICAILQMALSMDYSIMLMDRYRQEKDNVIAMKKALHHAFTAISSSSVTTIVGLLALVFMSFTIGRDLGFVLAKGVLFSLICIFFVLPSLILMFDKLIEKTKKKSPNIKLDKLGKASYKIRNIAIPLFLIVFIGSFLLKGNLNILYTDSQSDEISNVFEEQNQIALVYKNEDEEKVASYIKELEKEEKVDEVLGYGNTINEKLHYNELNDKLKDLGADVDVEEYLIKILYYNYYNKSEDNTMTFNEFTNFINKEVYTNPKMNEKLNNEMKKNINKLENFTTSNSINKKRTSAEIANILEIDENKVKDILIYYNSKNNNLKLSLEEFIDFINKDVLTNPTYAENIDSNTRNSLNTLLKFTNKGKITKKLSSKEMADLYEMPEEDISKLYAYYISVNEIDTKLTLSEFSNFVLNDVLTNSNYSNLFDDATISSIKTLSTFSNINIITKNMNSQEISSLFGIDENLVKQLLMLKYLNVDSGSKLSISEFINSTMYIKNNTTYLNNVDLSTLEKLAIFSQSSTNTTKMNKTQLSAIFDNFAPNLVGNIYLVAGVPDEYEMTTQEFVNFVLSTIENMQNVPEGADTPAFNPDVNSINNLKLLKMIIDDSITPGTKYTSTSLSKILNIDANQVNSIYALIDFSKGNTSNWISTPNEFVNLILNNLDNENIKNNIDNTTIANLSMLNKIMTSSINKASYTYTELSDFIGIDSSNLKNIYLLYTLKNNTTQLTPLEFVNFVLEHKNDETLSSAISSDTVGKLNLVKSVMNDVLVDKKYNNKEISNLLGIDEKSAELIYGLYYSTYIETNQTISLKEFVSFVINDVMENPDYSNNFDSDSKLKLKTINGIMDASLNNVKYNKEEILLILNNLSDGLDQKTIDLLYMYYRSNNLYNDNWTLTVEEFVEFLNDDILNDTRFDDFIENDMREKIIDSKNKINDAKELLIGDGYSRVIINTKFPLESEETFKFIQNIKDDLESMVNNKIYVIGDSPMAYEMSKTFQNELNFITVLTMILIFIVVAITFKSLITPFILVLLIQCAVYVTMGILSFSSDGVYFIAILIVQSILMGATIDYAILYTSYYITHRKTMDKKEAVIASYNKSINTILTSASILIIVTLIVGKFTSGVTSMICNSISHGTLCSAILILFLLPPLLAVCDKFIIKNKLTDTEMK